MSLEGKCFLQFQLQVRCITTDWVWGGICLNNNIFDGFFAQNFIKIPVKLTPQTPAPKINNNLKMLHP